MLKFFAEKMWVAFALQKLLTFFSAKNIRILYIESAKTVNEMTLNELVKLMTLWTTEPSLLNTTPDEVLNASDNFLRAQDGVLFTDGMNLLNDLWTKFVNDWGNYVFQWNMIVWFDLTGSNCSWSMLSEELISYFIHHYSNLFWNRIFSRFI